MTEAEAREIVERYQSLLQDVLAAEGFANDETVGHQLAIEDGRFVLRSAWLQNEGASSYFAVESAPLQSGSAALHLL